LRLPPPNSSSQHPLSTHRYHNSLCLCISQHAQHKDMAYTPQYASDFSTPPSPLFPPVPNVSRASIESLNSLYESDAARSSDNDTPPRTPQKTYYGMSTRQQVFSEEELFKAFADRTLSSSPRSKGERLAHDSSDPTSPWKRSIRLKYSEVNMREANSDKLREASDLLAKDMSSYVSPLSIVCSSRLIAG
jgi:hypothetical protein